MRTLASIISLLGLCILSSFAQTTHKVRSGEHLNSIAKKYGTTANVLQKYNGIQNANLLRVGQTIKIPAKGSTVTNIKTPPHPASHIVKKGDTFFAIAKKYGLSPEEFKQANPKINPNKISIGQKLVISGGNTEDVNKEASQPKYEADSVNNKASEKPDNTSPSTKPSSFTKVVITREITLGDFAKNYKMTVAQVNDINGWSYSADTLFDVGSEAYVNRP